MALTTRQGAGTLLTQAQGDANWNTLNGVTESITATTHTIDQTDENKTLEYSNASGVTVTLTAITTLLAATDSQISSFSCIIKNIGAGAVTVNCGGSDTFEDGSTSIAIPQYSSITIQTDSTETIWNCIGASVIGLGETSLASTGTKLDNFPSGTVMLFYQAAAPAGWTGDDTYASHALQVVTETSTNGGSTGGTVDFSTVFGLTATDGYTLLEADIPAHTHTTQAFSPGGATSGPYRIAMNTGGSTLTSNSTGGGGSHAHDIDLQVKYLNVIVATKD